MLVWFLYYLTLLLIDSTLLFSKFKLKFVVLILLLFSTVFKSIIKTFSQFFFIGDFFCFFVFLFFNIVFINKCYNRCCVLHRDLSSYCSLNFFPRFFKSGFSQISFSMIQPGFYRFICLLWKDFSTFYFSTWFGYKQLTGAAYRQVVLHYLLLFSFLEERKQ